jgi:GTP-binding protein HflX
VQHVFVGEPKRIYLPDLGRHRGGQSQLRGLRHVHTVLDQSALLTEDLADLTKLRLDLVAALRVDEDGAPGRLDYAHLDPTPTESSRYYSDFVLDVHDLEVDFRALVRDIEQELSRLDRGRRTDREGALLVGVYSSKSDAEWRQAEMQELCATAGVELLQSIAQMRNSTDPKYVVGKGKLEEVVLTALDLGAELVVFDHNLTPTQARSIAAASELKVIDRTQLILDIFAQHASSRDGKLQVELAQLKYNLPRLTDLDAGLSRLTGGIGGRGPGETKLEINRRRARDRITRLEREIDKLSAQRSLRRERRVRSEVPIVSIVGYTNAGKSTLLNRLTASEVTAQDKLFATLDPASRRLRFPREREAVITDTVGFIRDLPPDLMRAFRATLEELEGADVLLHVIDASDPRRVEKKETVEQLLDELELAGIPKLVVYNKGDLIDRLEARALSRGDNATVISATTGEGLARLVNLIAHRLWQIEVLPEDDPWAADARDQEFT